MEGKLSPRIAQSKKCAHGVLLACMGQLLFSRCSFEDYTWNYSTMPLGGLSFETESSWEDLMTPQSESAQPMSPQTESAQPMDYGLDHSGWFLCRSLTIIAFIVI